MKNRLFLTGGSGGIGTAISQLFLERNWDLLAPSRQEMDVSDTKSIESYFQKHEVKFDAFIYCAGLNEPRPFSENREEHFLKSFRTNVLGFFEIVRQLTPHMCAQKRGSIVAISSLYGHMSRAKRATYATSKHALNGMMKTLAIELGPHNVLVNTVSPGFVDTDMTRRNNDASMIQSLESKVPLRRLASTEDIARVAYFLCGPDNRYMSGHDLVVDGGFSVGGFQN